MSDGLVEGLRLDLLLQLALAVLLGGVVGLDRELGGKPAGLRTNILICLGATLFTSLSIRIGSGAGDPGRVAAQILTGVGFIGAGTILHTRGHVSGLTSAATIWVVAAIGMALGSGAYLEAVGSTAFVMVVLTGLPQAEAFLGRRAARSRLLIHLQPESTAVEEIVDLVQGLGLEVERTATRRDGADQVIELELRGPRQRHGEAVLALVRRPGVRSVFPGE